MVHFGKGPKSKFQPIVEHHPQCTTCHHLKMQQLRGKANELKMEVKQAILGLAQQGVSQRRIARDLGVHRKTVKRLLEEQPGFEGSKCATVMTGNRALTQSKCEPFREVIESMFEQGLDAKRIHRNLQAEHAFAGSYNVSVHFR